MARPNRLAGGEKPDFGRHASNAALEIVMLNQSAVTHALEAALQSQQAVQRAIAFMRDADSARGTGRSYDLTEVPRAQLREQALRLVAKRAA